MLLLTSWLQLVALPVVALELEGSHYHHRQLKLTPQLLAEPDSAALSAAIPLRFQAEVRDNMIPADHYALPRQLLEQEETITAEHWSVLGSQRVLHIWVELTGVTMGRVGLKLDGATSSLKVRFFAEGQGELHVNDYQYRGRDFALGQERFSQLLQGERLGVELSLPLSAATPAKLQIAGLTLLPVASEVAAVFLADEDQLVNARCESDVQALRPSGVMLLMPTGKLCSGNFLAAEPGKAADNLYLYTAAHCIGQESTAAGTLVLLDVSVPCGDEFKLNLSQYQTQYGTPLQLGNGTLLLSGDPSLENLDQNESVGLDDIQGDYSLLRFNKAGLPDGASITSLGWSTALPSQGWTVGHAVGYPQTTASYGPLNLLNGQSVIQADPISGITLPGASGSVLSNDRIQALGVLSAASSNAPFTTYFSTLEYALSQGMCELLTDGGDCGTQLPTQPDEPDEPVGALDTGGGGGGSLGYWLLGLMTLALRRRL